MWQMWTFFIRSFSIVCSFMTMFCMGFLMLADYSIPKQIIPWYRLRKLIVLLLLRDYVVLSWKINVLCTIIISIFLNQQLVCHRKDPVKWFHFLFCKIRKKIIKCSEVVTSSPYKKLLGITWLLGVTKNT